MSKDNEIFCENPYDIEILLDAIREASKTDEDYILLDKFISKLRKNPDKELIGVLFEMMEELGFMQNQLKVLLHEKG